MTVTTSDRDVATQRAEAAPLRPLLEVEALQTFFTTRHGVVKAVDGMSFTLAPGETLAIVGESGCGKSITALSLMRLVPDPPGRIVGGSVKLAGLDLIGLDEEAMRGVRGKDIAMIFQEPMSSLNPVLTIGSQIAEAVLLHEPLTRAQARQKAVDMLRLVRISEPEERAEAYPHQLSGGMRQRAMIAMALACHPKVLIADEPTTALDVTIQAQILAIMSELQQKLGTAVILITHDLGVVAETAQRVIVMYAGRKVEEASVADLFAHPQHPYTRGLLASIPRLALLRGDEQARERLQEIPGMVPALSNLPAGCVFAPRCSFAQDRCRASYPVYEEKRPAHWAACWRSREIFGARDG
ncbi:MAG: peptide/nickel transport system ATP-binding protein [Alphaproteobacteria bacterium]|jgi:peptide/nickel transport system ATP-binding protein|nr:peptide/nickel transport system ATP-binding protein [Alphaproteobacteria bacterium]